MTPDTPILRARLDAIRTHLAAQQLDALLVPRADEYLGEYLPAHNERLRWISGFTGSAGLAVVMADSAAIFVDGRYTVQVRQQVPEALFEFRHLIDEPHAQWLGARLGQGARIGFDARMHTLAWYRRTREQLARHGAELVALDANPVDACWIDRPQPGCHPAELLPERYTGKSSALKRRETGAADADAAWLDLPPAEDADAMTQLIGSSVTYRLAFGPQAGRKALMLRTIPPLAGEDPTNERVAKAYGFSLHAGVGCEAHQRALRERLCRYIARPAVAEQRLTVSVQGKVVYLLKTPYRDGTTHVVFEPLDFIARLAALVPRPRVHLTRYHGVLAPNHRWRAEVTPAGRGRGRRGAAQPARSAIERHAAMTWAQRLKRVFAIDVASCVRCGGAVRVMASIEDPALIERILAHVRERGAKVEPARGPLSTGPPVMA